MTHRTYGFLLGLSALALLPVFVPSKAQAGEPRMLASFGNWDTYIFMEDDHKVCYMATRPEKPEGKEALKKPPKTSKRGEPYALITHRPSEGTRNVFSYLAGYSYKPGTEVTVDIDGQKFVLFTQDNTAWAPDPETDNKLAKAIMAGTTMTVQGTPAQGTATTDTWSLKGSTAAHDKIDDECH